MVIWAYICIRNAYIRTLCGYIHSLLYKMRMAVCKYYNTVLCRPNLLLMVVGVCSHCYFISLFWYFILIFCHTLLTLLLDDVFNSIQHWRAYTACSIFRYNVQAVNSRDIQNEKVQKNHWKTGDVGTAGTGHFKS